MVVGFARITFEYHQAGEAVSFCSETRQEFRQRWCHRKKAKSLVDFRYAITAAHAAGKYVPPAGLKSEPIDRGNTHVRIVIGNLRHRPASLQRFSNG